MTDTENPSSSTPVKPDSTSCCTQRRVFIGIGVFVVVAVAVGVGVGLGVFKKGNYADLPYITPPVRSSMPVALKGSGSTGQSGRFRLSTLDPSTVIDRFFNPSGGPTNVLDILEQTDQRIQSINSRLDSQFKCMSNTPTPYTLSPWGQDLPFQVQCSENWSGGNGFDQWGVLDNVFYLYVRGGDGILAARVTSNNNGSVELVEIYFSVGVFNRNGSHCVGQIQAVPSQNHFEMAVAGFGIGFCGAQMRGSSSALNVTGSVDYTQCGPTDTVCTSAGSISVAANCTADESHFQLPPLGRKAFEIFGASAYPGGSRDTVTLTLTTNDDVYFGPTSPTV